MQTIIKLSCYQCGAQLDIVSCKFHKELGVEVEVEPCNDCQKKAETDGFEDGFERGIETAEGCN